MTPSLNLTWMHFAEMMPPPQMLTLISAANNTLRMSFAEGGKSLATNGLYAKLETFDYLTVFLQGVSDGTYTNLTD